MARETMELIRSAIDEAKGSRLVIECEDGGISLDGSMPSFIALLVAGQLIGGVMNAPEHWDVNMIADFVCAGIAMAYNDAEIGKAYSMVFADSLKKAAKANTESCDD